VIAPAGSTVAREVRMARHRLTCLPSVDKLARPFGPRYKHEGPGSTPGPGGSARDRHRVAEVYLTGRAWRSRGI
jgi:hypothetical protein